MSDELREAIANYREFPKTAGISAIIAALQNSPWDVSLRHVKGPENLHLGWKEYVIITHSTADAEVSCFGFDWNLCLIEAAAVVVTAKSPRDCYDIHITETGEVRRIGSVA